MKLKDIIYIAIILLITSFGAKVYFDIRADRERWIENFKQQKFEKNKLLRLTKKEMRQNEVLTDKNNKLLDSLKIKPKRIKEFETVYVTNIDTVHDTIKIKEPPPDYEYQPFEIKENCFKISGVAPCDFIIQEKSYNDTVFIIEFEKRRHLWGVNWLPRWGRLEHNLSTESKCSETKVEKLKLIK